MNDYEPIIEKFPKLETLKVNDYKIPDLEIWTDEDNKISLFNGEVDADLDNSILQTRNLFIKFHKKKMERKSQNIIQNIKYI